MVEKAKKILKRWIKQTWEFFGNFLDEIDFSDLDRRGGRGPKFQYAEWMIVFIAVLSAKLKIKKLHSNTQNDNQILEPNRKRFKST